MSDQLLIEALDRAERALSRLERAAQSARGRSERDEKLRLTVRNAVAELDSILAAGGR